ncbi:MAG: 50S ribosomal protein L15 [bacterium]
MRIEDLRPAISSKKGRKRVGCGSSSGHGGTSGRGHKGQKSRAGARIRPGFEGGQMPLYRRLPGKGFKPKNKKIFSIIDVKDLKRFEAGSIVDIDLLREIGLIKGRKMKVKVLGDGEIDRALTVRVHSFSKKAKEKIEGSGGKAEIIE